MAVRQRELKEKHLMKNLLTNNPIIISLRKEFKSLIGARELKHKTILCDIEWLDDSLLEDNNSDEELMDFQSRLWPPLLKLMTTILKIWKRTGVKMSQGDKTPRLKWNARKSLTSYELFFPLRLILISFFIFFNLFKIVREAPRRTYKKWI